MANPPAATVTLYRRTGCHLCDAAEQAIAPILRRYHLALARVDIEQDDILLQRYMFEIPVLALDGKVIATAPMSPRAIADALEEALGV